MKRIKKNRIKTVIPSPELIGSREAYYIKYDYEDVYFVSPAVYELLHDPDVMLQVMTDIKLIDLQKLVDAEINNLIVNGDEF
jgi:hypothetical protein